MSDDSEHRKRQLMVATLTRHLTDDEKTELAGLLVEPEPADVHPEEKP